MELNLIAGWVIGLVLGGGVVWFFMRHEVESARSVANAEFNTRLAIANEKYIALENIKNESLTQAEALSNEIEELRKTNIELAVGSAAEQQKNKNSDTQLQAAKIEISALTEQLQEVKNQLQKSQQDLTVANTTLGSERQTLATSAKLLDDTKAVLTEQLHQIVQQIPVKISDENKTRLDDVFKPFGEKLLEFQRTVLETSKSGVEKNAELSQQIKTLSEQSFIVSQSAENLTNALKGNSQTQGAWGELLLDGLLEQAGLRKGEEYMTQFSIKDDVGANFRPDVIVNLPDGKHIVIDSKVSIKDYDLYSSEQDSTRKQAYAKSHLESIKKHISDLSGKAYESKVNNTPGFTVMFIPIESAFALALANDSNLFQTGLKAGVVFATPTTLIAMLRTIEFGWRQERQQKNVTEIVRQASALYDKFIGFVDNLDEVDKKITQAHDALLESKKQLKTGTGNLITRVESMKKLGLKTTKALPSSWAENDIPDLQIENRVNEP